MDANTQTVDTPPVQDVPPEVNTAPDFETEFNNAFEKSLAGYKAAEPSDKPAEAPPKPVENPKPVDVKPDAKKDTKPDEGPLPDPESLEQAPPGKGSAQAKEGWNALRNNYKKAHRLAQERDEKIKKLETALAERGTSTQKETNDLKKQIEDLARYRAMVDIQSDPEFISKYDQPIEKAEGTIKEMLKGMNVSDDLISKIDFTNTKLMDKIVDDVSETQDKFTAKKIQRKVEDLLDLYDKRNETLQDQKKNFKEHLESKKKEVFSRDEEAQGKTLQHLEAISQSKDKEGNQMFPFLNKIETKDGMNQAQVDQANAHNKMVDLMTSRVHEVLKMNTPEQRSEIAVAAVTAHYLSAQLRQSQTKIKGLEEELKKISTVTTETDKAKQPPSVRRNGNGEFKSTDDALTEYFGR